MQKFQSENLCHDPIHGYIPFTSQEGLDPGEVAERELIDHPWLQRLRQIHQLQTAWWVFPTAEHTRFQHVLGAMHLGSRAIAGLYESLQEVCPDVPSRGYVESLLRLAGLLHDVGHGPFGHFFDEHFLRRHGLTHETLGGIIIRDQLGDLIRHVRRNPNSCLEAGEQLDPDQIAWLITRPAGKEETQTHPRWLVLLRTLLSGIYTIDNMDFVLRDAYMSGYSSQSFDLDRLLRYSYFSEQGLTIHDRGIGALVRFMSVRAELFRTIYFHRTVRGYDLALGELFDASRDLLFPGDPREHLDEYLRFTEWSLLVDVSRWERDGPTDEHRRLGIKWSALLARKIPWEMVCKGSHLFESGESEQTSIFSDAGFFEKKLKDQLGEELAEIELKIDISRHNIYRPHTKGPAQDQNFMFNSTKQAVRPLTDEQLIRQLPKSHHIIRVYSRSKKHAVQISQAFNALLGDDGTDDLTNM